MGEQAEDLLRLEVPCDREAPGRVREAVDVALRGSDAREDARLIASELVTGAVLHYGCDPERVLAFRATLDCDSLLIAVTSPCLVGGPAHLGQDLDGDLRLRVIDVLSLRWGREHLDGPSMWAELSV